MTKFDLDGKKRASHENNAVDLSLELTDQLGQIIVMYRQILPTTFQPVYVCLLRRSSRLIMSKLLQRTRLRFSICGNSESRFFGGLATLTVLRNFTG